MDPLTGLPDSSVSAPPAPPIATESQTSSATIPEQQAPAPPNVSAPDQQPAPQPRHGLAGMLDAIGDILTGGGRKPDTVSIDQNGQRTTQPGAPMTTGQKFAKVGLTALTGAARTLAAGTGPQNEGRGVGAAIGGAVADQERESDKADTQAETDFQRQQQAKIQNLNYQILSRKMAADTITQAQQKVKANQEKIDFSNRQVDREKQLGSYELGFVEDAGHIADLGAKDPNFIKNLHSGLIIPVAVYDTDGTTRGFDVYQRKPDANGQKFTGQIHMFTPGDKPGDPPKYTLFTPTDMNVGEATNADLKAASQYNEWTAAQQKLTNEKTENKLKTAQTAEAYSIAAKNASEKKVLDEANSQAVITSNATQLVHGEMDPSNLSKRSKSYDATLAEANRISMAEQGIPFDTGKAIGDYKYATNPQTYNTLNFLNSLVGRDGKGGNLGSVVAQSKTIGLKQLPALNKVEQWAKLQAGHPEVAAYRTGLMETADQVAKILQGGGTGNGTSDAKLQQAAEILNKDFGPKTMAAVGGELQMLLGNRKTEMIGTNRYLMRWNGIGIQPPAQPGQQAPATTQPGQQPPPPAPQTHVFSPSAWKLKNPSGDVTAATAQAKVQGFTITQ